MLDLNDLRLFVAIVEHQGILKAGRALNLPKSTVSRRLAGLEAQLKTRLIIRSGEEFTLTPTGQQAYGLGVRMVQAARAAEDRLLHTRHEIAGQVAISATSLIAARLPSYLVALSAPHPRLSFALDISERDPDPAGDASDLVLRAHAWALRDSPLIQRRICRNPLMLVAAPALLDRLGTPQRPGDLAGQDLLAFGIDARQDSWPLTHASGQVEPLKATPRLVSANTGLLTAAALQGLGLALLPEFCARDALASGALRPVLPGWTGPAVAVTLLAPSRQSMSATLRYCADQIALRVKSDILGPVQGVPKQEPRVPELPPADVTKLSPEGLSPDLCRVAPRPAPPRNSPESEMPMTPFQTALGTAALTAATVLGLPAAAQDAAGPLVLYTNDFEGAITDRFEADTGREVDVVQMSGGEILARIAAEAANPQWDVLIFNGSYTFHMLDQQDALLRGVEPANLANLNEIGTTNLPENRSWFPDRKSVV